MYSGITGEEFSADIYLGVVYYQRLRHMVNDKFQVRTTGPVDPLTRQPVKGRKRAGGIRFGEMERDALIAHGTSFLLQDRLMNCSDYSTAWVCRKCGSLVSLGFEEFRGETEGREYCRVCDRADVHEVKVESGNGDGGRAKPGGEIVERHGVGIAARRGQGMDVIAVPCEWSRDRASHRIVLTSPDVFRYLCAEMACMGIKLNVTVT
jgi:DNA-directed RNA polymerase I subunit RPA2